MRSPIAALPNRPRVNLAACFEACGLWCFVLLVGGVSVFALVLALERQAVQRLHDARWRIALQEVSERLEADLALGLELGDSVRAQGLLENALARSRDLVSAEVFDASGVTLFSTDRGTIGERVPDAWLLAVGSATSQRSRQWSVAVAEDNTIGTSIRGPFGEIVGQVCLTSVAVPVGSTSGMLVVYATLVLALGFVAWLAVRRILRLRLAAQDDTQLALGWQRLQTCQQRLQSTLSGLGEEGKVPR